MNKNIIGAAIFPHPPIIVDKIGGTRGQEAKITIDGVYKLSKAISELRPETIILVSPHGIAFRDAISMLGEDILKGDFENFGQSQLKYSFYNDLEMVEAIERESRKVDVPLIVVDTKKAATYGAMATLDHGALVPLEFLSKEIDEFNLVSITYGMLEAKELFEFGKCIKRAVESIGRRTILVASGDLSHRLSNDGAYPYSPYGEVFDKEVIKIVQSNDLNSFVSFDSTVSEGAGECGLRCFQVMAGFLDGININSEVISYEGPFGVGYLTALISAKQEDPIIKLAKKSLEHYVRTGKFLMKDIEIPEELLEEQAGCFVSLKKNGQLRGCIGTIAPTKDSLAEEIIVNAVSAGVYDSRFYKVVPEELEDLSYSVDVLKPAEPISDISQLDTEKYGVIVTSGMRRGLLLPNLEGIDSVEQQVGIALMKAGIAPEEPYTMERFEVIRHQ